MASISVVILFDATAPLGADGLPDLALPILEWVRIGSVVAVRVTAANFDASLRLSAGYVSDSERPAAERRMPAGMGPWCWDCYAQSFAFDGGDGWPPDVVEDDPGV